MVDDSPVALADSNALFYHLDNTPLALIEWDNNWRVVRWAGQAEAMFGWTADETLGKRPDEWRFVHEQDSSRIATLMNALAKNHPHRNIERNRNYTKSGEVRHCQWHNSIRCDAEGQFDSCLSLVLDVTERLHAEQELARSEERFKIALRSAGMFGWEASLEKKSYLCSGDYFKYFGGDGKLDFDTLMDVVHPADRNQLMKEILTAIEQQSLLDMTFRGAFPQADGRPRWFHARGQASKDSEGSVVMIGITADVTDRIQDSQERERLQKALLESQKAESLALLAGGIAHDFNNLVTVIIGNAALARMNLPDGNSAHGHLLQVEKACQRAAVICRQMLSYAGRNPVEPGLVDLGSLIQDSGELFGSTIGHRNRLEIDTPGGHPKVLLERQSIQQVLLNLVTNAAEAYGDAGGVVRIKLGRETIAQCDMDSVPPVDAGDYVFIDVIDHGAGIPDDVKVRMFDPFYSTKFSGRGLGLAAALGITRSHRGGLKVTSQLGNGTTVRLRLPVTLPKSPA